MEPVLQIAQNIAGETGHSLLSRLVEALSRHLNAVFVAITHAEGNPPTHARALYALREQEVATDILYKLDETPCARVYAGEVLAVPCGIAELYPRETGFEGYIGIPLRDVTGDVAGHLVVFSDDPIQETEVATAITTIFALRAEVELHRSVAEVERQLLIADLSRLNARLRRGYSELRRENTRKTELMGLIAHDLRSPLSALISQAELGLARAREAQVDSTKIQTAFNKVINNADRIAQMIDATLERTRADSEILNLNRNPCNLVGLLGIALEANMRDAERKAISITTAALSEIIADVDEALIISALDNLISNAVKYTHSGGAVQIALRTDGDTATITVTDNGQGMTSDDLARAFGRFQVLSARPTGGERSTGLGLANVSEIARAHGGTVRADSEGQGKGSRFCLTLPCRSSEGLAKMLA